MSIPIQVIGASQNNYVFCFSLTNKDNCGSVIAISVEDAIGIIQEEYGHLKGKSGFVFNKVGNAYPMNWKL